MDRFHTLKKVIVIILVTILVSITIVNFQKQTQSMVDHQLHAIIFDSNFISTMNNISKDIHGNVETSAFSPFVAYFGSSGSSSYNVGTPYGLESESELVDYMKMNNYTYLLVFENVSDEEALNSLFSEKVQDLDKDFQRINNYSTDNFKLRLYKIKGG